MKNTSWRTTVVGFAGAIFYASLPVIQTGSFVWSRDYPQLIKAVGIAVFGMLCKDFNITGLPVSTNAPEPASESAYSPKQSILDNAGSLKKN